MFLTGAKYLDIYSRYKMSGDKIISCHRNNKKHKYHVSCRVNIACCVDEETFMKHCFTKIYRLGGSVYFAPDSVTMAIAVIFESGFGCNYLVGGVTT